MRKNNIIGVVAIKGGVGKSQISFQLAARFTQDGQKVLLVDTDRQQTSYALADIRKETKLTKFDSISLFDMEVRKKIISLRNKYDIIIIDVGASDSESLRAALSVCDVIISPVVPASESIWSLDNKLIPLIEELKQVNPDLMAYSFINQAPSQGRDEEATIEYLKSKTNIKYIGSSLKLRTAFKNSVTLGKCINELKGKFKDKKAISEFENLFYNIKKVLKLI